MIGDSATPAVAADDRAAVTLPAEAAASADSLTPAAPAPPHAPPTTRRPQLLLALLTVALLLPFLNKPVHLDDPMYIWAAQRIVHHPLDFFGFTVNWYGVPRPMAHEMQNPPGVCYYLAATSLLLGWSEVAM